MSIINSYERTEVQLRQFLTPAKIEVSGQSYALTALLRGAGVFIPRLIRDGGSPKTFLDDFTERKILFELLAYFCK